MSLSHPLGPPTLPGERVAGVALRPVLARTPPLFLWGRGGRYKKLITNGRNQQKCGYVQRIYHGIYHGMYNWLLVGFHKIIVGLREDLQATPQSPLENTLVSCDFFLESINRNKTVIHSFKALPQFIKCVLMET